MKKLFQLGAVFFGILMAQNGFAQDYAGSEGYSSGSAYQGGAYASGSGSDCCAPQDQCCDQATNDCWCRYVHYEPCYYTTKRCVNYCVPCTRKCCRYCPKYYQVQRCRYVPQYYCETLCRYCPEYYDVCEQKQCTKTVCDTHCRYVPRYYWKHVCGQQQGCETGCAR